MSNGEKHGRSVGKKEGKKVAAERWMFRASEILEYFVPRGRKLVYNQVIYGQPNVAQQRAGASEERE